jgi:Uma2 family endonuclease
MRSIVIAEQLTIPDTVTDHKSFRRWAASDEFPEHARASYLDGKFWVDLPMERFGHNQCKFEIASVLKNLINSEGLGFPVCDGMLLTNIEAGLSTQPEFMFVSTAALEEGRATLIRGDDSSELIGTPDMTLEVISPSSIAKDTVDLRRLYWEAGVTEYWLVDCREKSFSFDILRHGPARFIVTRKHDGWVKSQVFGREFKLTRTPTKHGISDFTLKVR